MGTFTTDVPASAAGKSKRSADTLESEAIGLDVAVRVHGSQVAAVVLDTTEHVEPFEEDTSTMIVFPRGAVVKLRARVRTGHAVVLTHLGTKQTALCRIIQVNSTANVIHYVKLEFIQPVPGFWGVRFPSDADTPTPAHQEDAEATEEIKNIVTPPVAPANMTTPAVNAPDRQQTLRPVQPRQSEPKPIAGEVLKEATEPPAALPLHYGISAEEARKDEVVPLAAGPMRRTPFVPKAASPIQAEPAAPPVAAASSSVEPPIFDSLSTGEEIFGKEAVSIATEETSILKSDPKAAQAFGRSLDPSSLLQTSEVPKRSSGMKLFLSLAAVAILAAGAVFYVRQYRGNVRQSAIASVPASTPAATSALAASTAPTQVAAESPATAPVETQPTTSPAGRPAANHAPLPAAVQQATITVTPVHNNARVTSPNDHSSASSEAATIYAGNLSARPQPARRARATVAAPLPKINSEVPAGLTEASPSAGLGSLVGGAPSGLVAPPAAPAPIRGGQIVMPRLIHQVQPFYPAIANSNHVEGDVLIQASIDESGKVISAKAVSGPTLLRTAAVNAVRQWKYSPATLDGKPVAIEYKVTVRFRLGQ